MGGIDAAAPWLNTSEWTEVAATPIRTTQFPTP
jgi:hypothetical protein